MNPKKHWAVFINNRSNKGQFIRSLIEERTPTYFKELKGLRGALFSKLALNKFMDEEERHGFKEITKNTEQSLKSMSSGEQKKALLQHLMASNPDFLILDNPYDNLDIDFQGELKKLLTDISKKIALVQIISRKSDLLPFIGQYAYLDNDTLTPLEEPPSILKNRNEKAINMDIPIPPPLQPFDYQHRMLISLKNVSVQFSGQAVLQHINWKIKKGEFWQLVGKNGSGKTTLLSMVTGENSKGYGQELYIFGQKKGSGESVWDIKKKIGYFTPSMTDKFTGYHTVENMIISGLFDSVGLYKKPTNVQIRLATSWLRLIEMWDIRHTYFHDLSMGQKRLVMTVRAMVKHPLLLILDEPIAGLDDKSALLLVTLVNKIAKESSTTIIFVSHRKEEGLEPQYIYELEMTPKGSMGKVIKNA